MTSGLTSVTSVSPIHLYAHQRAKVVSSARPSAAWEKVEEPIAFMRASAALLCAPGNGRLMFSAPRSSNASSTVRTPSFEGGEAA